MLRAGRVFTIIGDVTFIVQRVQPKVMTSLPPSNSIVDDIDCLHLAKTCVLYATVYTVVESLSLSTSWLSRDAIHVRDCNIPTELMSVFHEFSTAQHNAWTNEVGGYDQCGQTRTFSVLYSFAFRLLTLISERSLSIVVCALLLFYYGIVIGGVRLNCVLELAIYISIFYVLVLHLRRI